MMMAEHHHLAKQGVDMVELRMDYIRRPVNVQRLFEQRPCPAVATCRRQQDGGRWQRSETERVALLRTAIADGADFVDIEHDLADQIPRYGNTKRIVSYHNFMETPNSLEAIHRDMKKKDPDIIKIATLANHPNDNLRALELCKNSSIPTIAFCMGDMGLPSRILCGKFGAPMTYATFHKDRQMAPGQLSWKEMLDEYRYKKIGPNTKVLGVVADPVGHSLSPRVHNACFESAGLDMIYLPFRVPAEHLQSFIDVCHHLDILGLSVTIPHKERILKSLDGYDSHVKGIKAANTVVNKDNRYFGYNTDCDAAISCLTEKFAEIKRGESLKGQVVLILGSGGTARSVAFGLKELGAEIRICGRDYRKAENLANALGCKYLDWPSRQNFEYDILVNTTPVGMHPNVDETPFDTAWLKKRAIVFDVVYNPEQTLLIKQAREFGCETITGIDMFVRQAAAQFKLFTGQNADEELIRQEIRKAINPARY